jgi:hypothetical protein
MMATLPKEDSDMNKVFNSWAGTQAEEEQQVAPHVSR